MIGDLLHVEQHHIEKAEFIVDKIMKHYHGKPMIISIGGGSGTGKTEITQEVHKKMYNDSKYKLFSISNDDYYLTPPEERNKKREENNIIGHKELNWNKINKLSEAFKNQSTAYIQEYHLYSNKFLHTEFNFSGVDWLIFEGLYAGFLKGVDLYFYLDANYLQTYRFRKTRGKEDPDDNFRKRVLKIEGDEIRKTKDKADYIIPYTFA